MTGGRAALMTIVALAMAASLEAGAEPRAIIELFTSQGCSSCPPADKLLGELARDPTLVTLSLSVDYWDYLGWKDTLALAGHAKRQKAYSRARGDRDVYTPQVVVSGMTQALGSDRAEIERAIAHSRRNPRTLALPLTLSVAHGQVTVAAPAGRDGERGEIWLCSFSSAVLVAIGRGENKGRTVTYHNVVRRWVKAGDWTGAAAAWSVPITALLGDGLDAVAQVDAVAAILQAGSAAHPGPVLGAATATLR